MALDTQDRRASAIYGGLPWRGLLPLADGAVDEQDRIFVSLHYSGLVAGAPEPEPEPPPQVQPPTGGGVGSFGPAFPSRRRAPVYLDAFEQHRRRQAAEDARDAELAALQRAAEEAAAEARKAVPDLRGVPLAALVTADAEAARALAALQEELAIADDEEAIIVIAAALM